MSEPLPSPLIVTPCSATKQIRVPDPPSFEDLVDPHRRDGTLDRLARHALPAREMPSRSVMAAVDRLRTALPTARVEVAIVSVGYGVLAESEPIVPYEATFVGLSTPVAAHRAQVLGIRDQLARRLRNTKSASSS